MKKKFKISNCLLEKIREKKIKKVFEVFYFSRYDIDDNFKDCLHLCPNCMYEVEDDNICHHCNALIIDNY